MNCSLDSWSGQLSGVIPGSFGRDGGRWGGDVTREDEDQVAHLRADWISGGLAGPVIGELIRLKRMDEAGALARLALNSDRCQDREVVEKLPDLTGSPPPGWTDAVLAFSQNPTPEGWDNLMSFTPNKVLYQRTRNTLRILRRMGTDANALFRCATRTGTVPDAFDLVQSGEVNPETVVERGWQGPPEARALWFGLAAEAAFVRGDELGTVRLLKMAYAEAADDIGPETSVMVIRRDAGDELQKMLDSAGIPRLEGT